MSDTQALVLVVDDNEVNRDVLSRRLNRYGHEVETAENGRQALRMIREREYDLVLLDIMMPEMNGYQVLERIKDDPITRGLPVIVISALDDIESIVKCIQMGAEDYLPKPFNPLLLKARITASLDKKRMRDREQTHLEEQAITQRIDRELNAKLDIKSVARITLDWAKRRSQTEAIFIGQVTPHGLKILDAAGCDGLDESYPSGIIPLDALPMQRAIETILPQASTDPRDYIMPESRRQVVMPLGRAGQVLALMILERHTVDQFPNEVLSFLTRLSDRAAVALSNALLYEAVQRANIEKSEFVSEVSHELKNPMTSIMNYAKMIGAMGNVNEMQKEFIQTIISNVNRMSQLVSDLSDMSRIESGHLRLELDSTPVTHIVQEVVASFKGQIAEKQQDLVLDVPTDLPPLWCDKNRTAQVLTNLVSNAHKYTPVSGRITLRAHLNGDGTVHLAVADTGIGLRPEDQAKIFQKYFRAADEQAKASPGTGLGLNITKKLVEMQGGKIWFESEFRQGTTFHFTIPAVQ
ncbi:MAG: response regulator [Chloroflexi bacterium]|nr:response regulator [Chloroflexota bacterium]